MSRNVGGGRRLGSKNAVHVRLAAERRREPTVNAEELRQLADALHEARCGGAQWPGSDDGPPVPWPVTHREWDEATAKALDLLGVGFRSNQLQVIERDRLARSALREQEPGETLRAAATDVIWRLHDYVRHRPWCPESKGPADCTCGLYALLDSIRCECGHKVSIHTDRDVSDVVGWPCNECRSARCPKFRAALEADSNPAWAERLLKAERENRCGDVACMTRRTAAAIRVLTGGKEHQDYCWAVETFEVEMGIRDPETVGAEPSNALLDAALEADRNPQETER